MNLSPPGAPDFGVTVPDVTDSVRTTLQIIGGGKMAEALVGGLVANGWAPPEELHIVEPDDDRRADLATLLPGVRASAAPIAAADVVVAVKPNIVPAALDGLADTGVSRVVSIAAGVQCAAMEAHLPEGTAVVRCMPNTPALVGQGAAGIAPGVAATAADLEWASSILGAVGTVVIVDESDIDAVTGLSGSGPAYVFHLAEALIAAGIAEGLAPDTADVLARQTLLGAATLLSESGEDPAVLRTNVTSPNGTTQAGLEVFAEADLMAIVARVVKAATDRSRELGGA
ncbi:MAG: pyrroline-5-carboxylate reductase [Acidimicrobiales bacterium]|nr:MAG: pyrroline-5-carboxylate reductase [Acidimicrobiales bacterium]